MTREEFIKVLNKKRHSYEIEGDKIVVIQDDVNLPVVLRSINSLPPDVVFKNEGNVLLDPITSLPPGFEFKNSGDVYLNSLTSIPSDVVFNNGGDVELRLIRSLSIGVVFNNGGGVFFGGWFHSWEGNIEGIDSKRLLNKMIKDGVFER